MPRGVKKENLPFKQCVTCGRPFTWRKKWERCWDEVSTCSKSCNKKRRTMMKNNKSIQPPPTAAAATILSSLLRSDVHKEDHDELVLVDNNDLESSHLTGVPSYDHSSDDSWRDYCFKVVDDDVGSKTMYKEKKENNDDEDEDVTPTTTNHNVESPHKNRKNHILDATSIDHDATTHNENSQNDSSFLDTSKRNAMRKAAKKLKKQQRRAQREGRGDPTAGQKQCHMCGKSVDLLIRCTYDESLQWHMVCGKCWKVASGGVVDGDAAHPFYRYGGLWKNRRKCK